MFWWTHYYKLHFFKCVFTQEFKINPTFTLTSNCLFVTTLHNKIWCNNLYIKYKVMVKCFNNFTVATIAILKIYSILYEVFNSALEEKCFGYFLYSTLFLHPLLYRFYYFILNLKRKYMITQLFSGLCLSWVLGSDFTDPSLMTVLFLSNCQLSIQ